MSDEPPCSKDYAPYAWGHRDGRRMDNQSETCRDGRYETDPSHYHQPYSPHSFSGMGSDRGDMRKDMKGDKGQENGYRDRNRTEARPCNTDIPGQDRDQCARGRDAEFGRAYDRKKVSDEEVVQRGFGYSFQYVADNPDTNTLRIF